jgi:hypothetical protein
MKVPLNLRAWLYVFYEVRLGKPNAVSSARSTAKVDKSERQIELP